MAGGSLMIGSFNAGSFIVNLGSSYLLGRLTAQDGPRLGNRAASGGDYGVPIPRAVGEVARLTGAFLAQADIQEHEHTVEDYSEIVGALTGAAQGFMIGGPIGAAIGAVIGGLLGFATPDQKYYTYTDTFALLFLDRADQDPIEGLQKLIAAGKTIFNPAESAVLSETLDGDGRLIKRKYDKNRFFKSLTIYGGGLEQPVDPILAALVGEASAFRPWAYAVIEELQLAPWNNSVPSVEAIILVKAGETAADAMEFLCSAAGIDPLRDVSTTALTDRTVKGMWLTSETSCWDAAKPLLPAFGVDCGEVAGQLRFYKRSQTMRASITPDDMGAHIFGDSPPDKLKFKRGNDLQLPQEVALTFVDPDRDYQPNTQLAHRTEGDARSNKAVSVPLVMTASEGASAAALMLWDEWLGRTQVSFTLMDSWNPQPGLAYGVPFTDRTLPYRIIRATRGANGITEVEAVSDESVTYSANVAGSSGSLPDDESTLFPDTQLILMDMPLLQDGHDDYGFYVVQSGSESYWTRGFIQVSSNLGANWVTIIDQPYRAVMGDVTGTLAAGSTDGLDDTLDTVSVLTVVLLHDGMVLESASDEQLDAWANFAYVGKDGLGEYLQFKTATRVDFATWQLTNLRRGRRGTDHAIATHSPGEEFALLGGAGVFRIAYSDPSQWGETLHFRGVTLHQDPEDADEQDFANSGEGKRPFSPVNVEGSWDGSNNLTISWDSRSRLFAGGLGIDDQDNYEVEITNATPVRTITATGVETASYSAADQAADGLVAGQIVEGRVRQLSDVNDGRWREFTLYGPLASTADSTIITADETDQTADMG